MAYYVRKIVRSKWALVDQQSEDVIDNYKADAIANDLRTTGNTISLWRMEDLSDKSMEPLIVINSLLGDTISKIELLIIPEDKLTDFSLHQEDGDTVVSRYRNIHFNIDNLTVEKHLQFARDVVLKIVQDENAEPQKPSIEKLIRRIGGKEQLALIEQWLSRKEFDIEELKDKQKEAVNKYIRRTR